MYTFHAEPSLCVAATLQKVIYDMTNSYHTQQCIADFFGVYYPPDALIKGINRFSYTTDSSKWGIIIKKGSINQLFSYLSLPLNEEFYPINSFDEYSFESFIEESLIKGKKLICGYSKSALDKNIALDEKIGHVTLIQGIDKHNSKMEIFDTDPSNYGVRWVESYALFIAILKKDDGIWVITKLNP